MDITSVNNSCVAHTHRHHAYFRLDFDIAGAANDFADFVDASGSRSILTEEKVTDTAATRAHWRLGSIGSRARVHVERTPEDGFAGTDTFAQGRRLAVRVQRQPDRRRSAQPLAVSRGPRQLPERPERQGRRLGAVGTLGYRAHGRAGGHFRALHDVRAQVKVSFGTVAADFDGSAASDLKIYRNGTWISFSAP